MTFNAANFVPLSSMANSAAPRFWAYVSTEAADAIAASGYFDNAAANNGLATDDVIMSLSPSTGGAAALMFFSPTVSAGGTVTTTKNTNLLT